MKFPKINLEFKKKKKTLCSQQLKIRKMFHEIPNLKFTKTTLGEQTTKIRNKK
jgi:hypothetical protein